jgi:hypothetical protein
MPATPPLAIHIEYADGVRGTVLLLNGHLQDFVAAARTADGAVHACRFDVGSPPGMSHFNEHAAAIDEFLMGGNRLPLWQFNYGVLSLGRTLATTGILESAMQSHSLGGRQVLALNRY